MTKIYKQKKSLKIKNLRKNKTIKLNGGVRSESMTNTNRQLRMLPPTPEHDILSYKYPEIPRYDPLLRKLNDDCYNADQNLKNLKILLEREKQLIIEGRKQVPLLCQYFNKYITALKKQPFYDSIYLETLAPSTEGLPNL